jgi:hypothetical protein
MTYVARTNWQQAYTSMENQVKVSKADALAFKEEMEHAKGDKAKVDEQLTQHKQAADKEQLALKDEINGLQDKLKRSSEEIAKHVATNTAAGAELKRRANESDYLKQLVTARDDELRNKAKQVNDMRAAMVEAKINFDAERERNERLLQENERLARDNRQIQQVASSTSMRPEAPKKNPPPEDVEGRITRYDPQNGYVTISIGSDAGLREGNTLDAFRLGPDPAYLGAIQILRVRPNEAVGKAIDRLQRPLQVGDQVSSSIMRRR